jgi:hypothetical protein
MDKVKQNIILQQQLDKFNIEKSVIGTEAYEINQDIQKGMSQDEIIEKARSGVYKLTAENKKMGRVGQKYGESKKDDKQNDTTLRDLETKLNYAKDFSPHKVGYYEQLIKEHKEKSNPKESTEKKEGKSKAASKVLQLMDSEPDGELHYGKYVSQVVKEMGVNREELEKELDKYV